MKKKVITIFIIIITSVALVEGFQYWNENIRVGGVPIDETADYFCANANRPHYWSYRDNFDQNYQEWKNMVLNVSPARRRGNIKYIKECYYSTVKTYNNAQKQLNQMRSQGIPVDKIVKEIKEEDKNTDTQKFEGYIEKKYSIDKKQFRVIYYDYISDGIVLKYYERLFNDLHIDPNQN